jgi:hypothetical protein
MHDDDLTPSEKDAFATLPRERMPSAGQEDAVVKALYERGLLGARRRRVVAVTPVRVAALVAASVAFMVAGFAAGQWTTLRQITSSARTLGSDELSSAAALQYTAAAYLSALENFAALPDTTADDDARQGREVALKTLYTAADRVSHMVPRDYLAGKLLDAIDVAVGTPAPAGADADTTTTGAAPWRGLAWF